MKRYSFKFVSIKLAKSDVVHIHGNEWAFFDISLHIDLVIFTAGRIPGTGINNRIQ